jgi:hypothetical protein
LGTTASKRIEAAYAENEKRLASSKGRRYQHSSQDHRMNLIHNLKKSHMYSSVSSSFNIYLPSLCDMQQQLSLLINRGSRKPCILNQGVGRSYPPSLSRSYKWPTCDRKTRKSDLLKLFYLSFCPQKSSASIVPDKLDSVPASSYFSDA